MLSKIIRTPNTKVVYGAVLVSEIQIINELYELMSKDDSQRQELLKRILGWLDSLYALFKPEEGKEKLTIDQNIKGIAASKWQLLNKTKAKYAAIYKREFEKQTVSKTSKKTVTVRGVNKLLEVKSSHSLRGGKADLMGFSNKNMMIIDIIATKIDKQDDEWKKKLLRYKFTEKWQAERVEENLGKSEEDIIYITLTNEEIRAICGKKALKSEEIKTLLEETSNLEVEGCFYTMINQKEYQIRRSIRSKPFDLCVAPAEDKRKNMINKYLISLNTTPMGCLLLNNFINNHFDYVNPVLYSLSGVAQNLFRKLVITSFNKPYKLKESNIKHYAGILNTNKSSARKTLVKALDELKSIGLIKDWEVTEGKNEPVYNIYMFSKRKNNSRYVSKERKDLVRGGEG